MSIESRSESRPGFVPVQDYLHLPHDPSTWVIKNLLPISGAGLIYSPPKVGKTGAMIQLACALSGGADEWLGFPIITHGPVLFLELDTPRSTFRLRFKNLDRAGIRYVKENLLIADRECLNYFPFDISKQLPNDHMAYLHSIVQPLKPVAVIIDTLRKVHSRDEDSSTEMSNVVSRLIGAVHPAALLLVSHSRKPNQEGTFDLMADHRGSGAVTGEMDMIIKLSKSRMYFGGRNIEEGDIKLDRIDDDGMLLWKVKTDENDAHIQRVLADTSLQTMRSKAKALAPMINKTEEACMSIIRRVSAVKHPVDNPNDVVKAMSTLAQSIPEVKPEVERA